MPLQNLKSKNHPLDIFQVGAAGDLSRTLIFGILNCTPDSFSDAGVYENPLAARRRVFELFHEGADCVDVGAESTRPGATAVSPQAEWSRLESILTDDLISELIASGIQNPVLSIDTRRAEIARRALARGVQIVNDVSGGAHDPEMHRMIAEAGCPYVFMHMRGTPASMQSLTDYGKGDLLATLQREIAAGIEKCLEAGVEPGQIILDPGIGFAKTAEQSLEILSRLHELSRLHLPILIGVSRKSFLRLLPASPIAENVRAELDFKTLNAVLYAILNGAAMVRIHNVKDLSPAIRQLDMIRGKRV